MLLPAGLEVGEVNEAVCGNWDTTGVVVDGGGHGERVQRRGFRAGLRMCEDEVWGRDDEASGSGTCGEKASMVVIISVEAGVLQVSAICLSVRTGEVYYSKDETRGRFKRNCCAQPPHQTLPEIQ